MLGPLFLSLGVRVTHTLTTNRSIAARLSGRPEPSNFGSSAKQCAESSHFERSPLPRPFQFLKNSRRKGHHRFIPSLRRYEYEAAMPLPLERASETKCVASSKVSSLQYVAGEANILPSPLDASLLARQKFLFLLPNRLLGFYNNIHV